MDDKIPPETGPSKSATAVKLVLSIVYMALIFLAAGTVNWPEFWFFLGFYVTTTSVFVLWLKKHDPGLFKERMGWKLVPKVW